MEKSAKRSWPWLLVIILVVLYSFGKVRLGLHWDELTAIEEGIMIQKGAHFISEDWSPLQFTAFVLAPLAALWKAWVGSYTGIILALRYLYLFLQLAIAVYLYFSLKTAYGQKEAYLVSLMHYLYFFNWTTITYKSMLYMGGIVAIISILNYCGSKKTRYLILAGVASIYMVLGYPHSLLVCAGFCLAIWKLAGAQRKKALWTYVACCMAIGVSLLLYILIQCGGVAQLLAGITGILSDENHAGGLLPNVRKLVVPIVLLFILENGVAMCVEKVLSRWEGLEKRKGILWSGAFLAGLACVCLARIRTAGPSRFWYIFLTVFLLTPHFLGKDFLRKNRREFYLFTLPSVFMMLSIVMATNQGIAIVSYGTIWGLMGLVLAIYSNTSPRNYRPVAAYILAAMGVMFVLFVPDMAGGSANIFWKREMITAGSAQGIYVEAATKERYDLICDMVGKYAAADDRLLIVSEPDMAAGFMSTDAMEATFAPNYVNPTTARYVAFYEAHPHRAPNVILLDKEFTRQFAEDFDTYLASSPLGEYISENFGLENRIEDGKFVIYRKDRAEIP